MLKTAGHRPTSGVEVIQSGPAGLADVLTPEAIEFLAFLHRRFEPSRRALLQRRAQRQARLDAGEVPDFLPETADLRAADWTVAPVPAEIQDRRVEITGPVDRKMVINALNSGARVFMADFEDSHSPTWDGTIQGQINLRDAVRRTITYASPEGKPYQLGPSPAVLMVRPRGWHLVERHVAVDGEEISASLFDFGLFLFHNAAALLAMGSRPYFYLPKLEGHLEARLWNEVLVAAQRAIGVPPGTARVTVLIETILAAFEMDEILHELRDHAVGLNCGRWDYIFSVIKKFRLRPEFVLPDRAQVTMTTHFLRSYSRLLVRTCHRRGAHAMGGMAAQIPIRGDPRANDDAIAKVRADKEREARDGHDGTWVAHPGLVPVAMEVFDRLMPGPNQVARRCDEVSVTGADLLRVPDGTITEAGLRANVAIALRYLESWLRGVGCVPIFNLMEDAATAEISRAQTWQWIRHPRTVLADGRRITAEMFRVVLARELDDLRAALGHAAFADGRWEQAGALLDRITTSPDFVEFLTLPAYDQLS